MNLNSRAYERSIKRTKAVLEREGARLFAEIIEREARIEALKAELKQAEDLQNELFAKFMKHKEELKLLGFTDD